MSRGPRRNVEPTKRLALLAIGVAALLLGGVLLWVAFTAQKGLPGQDHYVISARFRAIDTLGDRGADVRIAGQRVGQVLNGRLDHGVPTVDLQLAADAGPLPADTTARIRPRGLLGAAFIDLRPGTSRVLLADGATLEPSATGSTAQLSDVLDALDAPRRADLRDLLRGAGGGLAGRGRRLNVTFADAPEAFGRYSRALAPLLRRDAAVTRFVAGAESFVAALEPVRAQIAQGFGRGRDALAPFANESASVRSALDRAPGMLNGTRSSLRAIDPLLTSGQRFARVVARVSHDAPRALRATTRLLTGGRAPLRDARTVLEQAHRSAAPVVRLGSALDPLLPRLRATLDIARDPVTVLGRHGCDLRGFWANWRSFLGYGPPTQTGPLGSHTILRLTVGAPGMTVLDQGGFTHGAGAEDRPAPCALGGPMP